MVVRHLQACPADGVVSRNAAGPAVHAALQLCIHIICGCKFITTSQACIPAKHAYKHCTAHGIWRNTIEPCAYKVDTSLANVYSCQCHTRNCRARIQAQHDKFTCTTQQHALANGVWLHSAAKRVTASFKILTVAAEHASVFCGLQCARETPKHSLAYNPYTLAHNNIAVIAMLTRQMLTASCDQLMSMAVDVWWLYTCTTASDIPAANHLPIIDIKHTHTP